MTPLPLTARVALAALVLLAAAWDLRTRRIPNWLCAAGALAGLALQPVPALLGGGLGLLLQLPFFYWGKIGGGDVKLLAACGALLGPFNLLLLFVLSSIFEGAAALVLIVCRRGDRKLPRAPFVAVAAGLLLAALQR